MDQPVAPVDEQPYLHDAEVALCAPTQVWSEPGGDYGGSAIHGQYFADWRLIKASRLLVGGEPPECIGSSGRGTERISRAVVRGLDAGQLDPRVLVERRRLVESGRVVERVSVLNGLDAELVAPVELSFDVAFEAMKWIKVGRHVPHPVEISADEQAVTATDGTRTVRFEAAGARLHVVGDTVLVAAELAVPPQSGASFEVTISASDASAVVTGGAAVIADLPATGDAALDRWAGQALADLRGLLMDAGQGAFVAAGAPWFFTLFGRDSLITARFLLPLSLELAETTLRTLASRQGTKYDAGSAEQPGKIMHELRSEQLEMPGEGLVLPPVYYGTIDATGLWIILLHDAWRAGLADDVVRGFLDPLRAALGWLRDDATPDGSGFLRYLDTTGHGLANQGWKDSRDSIRFHDGRIAEGPIALAEVQAQACLAAEDGAALLDAFGDDGVPWRRFAQELRERFRAAFWVTRHGLHFPAIALDGAGRPVDSLTSNMGQLLGTTLLNSDEEAQLADLLVEPRFASGYGLRTMASDEDGYWPLSYHCGSVWTHDTAVAIEGMLRAGLAEQARVLARQLVRAADAFGSRIPELFAGYSADEAPLPVSYPASCRPQAWAAAAVVPVYRALAS